MPDGARRSLESQRDESLNQMEYERRRQRGELASATREQLGQADAERDQRVGDMEMQKAGISDQIAGLEAALADLPPDHPQHRELQNKLNTLRKYLAMLESQINSLKFKMASHKRMILFRANMQEKMLGIRFANKKSLMLRQFAERIMQLEQTQMQLSRQQNAGGATSPGGRMKRPAEAKEMGQATG
jgi:chromosome segregation ATPase